MMANAKKIKWDVMTEALPSFVTIFIVPFSFNLLRGATFGYVTWGVLAIFSGEVYTNLLDFYYEFRSMIYGDTIPTDTTDDGSYTQIQKKDSQRWYSLEALGFGDIRLPKSKFDLSTVVHNSSVDDLTSMQMQMPGDMNNNGSNMNINNNNSNNNGNGNSNSNGNVNVTKQNSNRNIEMGQV